MDLSISHCPESTPKSLSSILLPAVNCGQPIAERAGLLVFVVAVQRGIGFSLRRAGIRSATVDLQGIGAGRRTARRGLFLAIMGINNQFFCLLF